MTRTSTPARRPTAMTADWRPAKDIVQIMQEREIAGHFLEYRDIERTARKYKLDLRTVSLYVADQITDADLRNLRGLWGKEREIYRQQAIRKALDVGLQRLEDFTPGQLTHFLDRMMDHQRLDEGEPNQIIEERRRQIVCRVRPDGVFEQVEVEVPISGGNGPGFDDRASDNGGG